MKTNLLVVNAHEATFECTFGRGCEGVCCKNGRPTVDEEEIERINDLLPEIMDQLVPAAQKLINKSGITSNRRKEGFPMLRVVNGWCIFFNKGCVLHRLGMEHGDALKYKPQDCSLFPLAFDYRTEEWYVRQHGTRGEKWNDLFCLNPANSKKKAATTLAAEIALVERIESEE
ncbi:MAG: DUF3109 family protein [Zavarzinella sp.]